MASGDPSSPTLSFSFRSTMVPATLSPAVTPQVGEKALVSEPFRTWIRRCERVIPVDDTTQHRLELHSVELQSVDLFGARGVGFIKLKSHCTLTILDVKGGIVVKETKNEDKPLPGICLLRGGAVSILVALFCKDGEEEKTFSLLVEQPRVPLGQAACLELPAGMVDDETETVAGIAVQEMREECGIHVASASDLVDLTELSLDRLTPDRLPGRAIPPSPGGCDEVVRYFYLEKQVTPQELDTMRGRLEGLREHGEFITLRVVPMEDVWKISGDAKAMISLFLVDQLRKEGKLPNAGELATPLVEVASETSSK